MGGGLVDVVGVRLVGLGVVLHPLALLLVAGLAAVASPPVVALGNVHADVHSVVTCQDEATGRVGGGATEGGGEQVRLRWKQEITLILKATNLHRQLKDEKKKENKQLELGDLKVKFSLSELTRSATGSHPAAFAHTIWNRLLCLSGSQRLPLR